MPMTPASPPSPQCTNCTASCLQFAHTGVLLPLSFWSRQLHNIIYFRNRKREEKSRVSGLRKFTFARRESWPALNRMRLRRLLLCCSLPAGLPFSLFPLFIIYIYIYNIQKTWKPLTSRIPLLFYYVVFMSLRCVYVYFLSKIFR